MLTFSKLSSNWPRSPPVLKGYGPPSEGGRSFWDLPLPALPFLVLDKIKLFIIVIYRQEPLHFRQWSVGLFEHDDLKSESYHVPRAARGRPAAAQERSWGHLVLTECAVGVQVSMYTEVLPECTQRAHRWLLSAFLRDG